MGRPPVVAEKMIELKKGQWAPHEDIKLVSYVEEHGASKWNLVPENAGLQRSGKSCRSRWMNHLRPGIKQGKFTADEEQIIIRHQARLDNRWAAIASHLAGRTDNSVKNYWYTHLKKKLGKVNNHGDEATGNSIAAPFSHAPPAPATTTALGREGFYYPPNILRSSPAPSTTPGRVDFYYQSSIFLPLGSDQISFGPF